MSSKDDSMRMGHLAAFATIKGAPVAAVAEKQRSQAAHGSRQFCLIDWFEALPRPVRTQKPL